MAALFKDRLDASEQLLSVLQKKLSREPLTVFALPRGGVQIGKTVADEFKVPLHMLISRKIGHPQNSENAIGAVTETGSPIWAAGGKELLGKNWPKAVRAARVQARSRRLAFGTPMPQSLVGRTAIVLDDGVATGLTLAAAVADLRRLNPKRVVVAVPLAHEAATKLLSSIADQVVVLHIIPRKEFTFVGAAYKDFSSVSSGEVRAALATTKDIAIKANGTGLKAYLAVPPKPRGVIVFAHGSGSGRQSPRNQLVAKELHKAGFATLLPNLLTAQEDTNIEARFNIDLLTARVLAITDWLLAQPEFKGLPLGYFGASTGAAAALDASVHFGSRVYAVLSRGGRPDLAKNLEEVTAPTLCLVGGKDKQILAFHRQKAIPRFKTKVQLRLIPRAGHLFEEAEAIHKVSAMARVWFVRQLK